MLKQKRRSNLLIENPSTFLIQYVLTRFGPGRKYPEDRISYDAAQMIAEVESIGVVQHVLKTEIYISPVLRVKKK